MFSAEIVVKTKENRRSTREKVDMPGHLTTEGTWRSICRIADISCHGARIETFSMLAKNTVVWVNLPGMPARKGEIVWSDEFQAACKFFVPLEPVEVIALVGRYGFDVEAERPLETMVMVS